MIKICLLLYSDVQQHHYYLSIHIVTRIKIDCVIINTIIEVVINNLIIIIDKTVVVALPYRTQVVFYYPIALLAVVST